MFGNLLSYHQKTSDTIFSLLTTIQDTWLYPLTAKAQVKDIFILFKPLVETRFQAKFRTSTVIMGANT